MKFLLCGASGYIGTVLQEELVKAGHSFVNFDSDLLGLTKEDKKAKNPTIIASSYDNHKEIDKFKGYDIIVNLAAHVGDPMCLVDTQFALMNNCLGTKNIVSKAEKENKPLIHLSTSSIYGSEDCTLDDPLTEDVKTFPIDFYGQTKYQQERYVKSLNNYCMFRLGTAYGQSPRMRYDLVIPTFTAKAVNDKKIVVFGGNQYRPFVHIRDVARAIIFAGENNLRGIYNLANENLKIIEVAEKIRKIYRETKIETNKMISDPRNYIVSDAKLLSKGFKFKFNVDKGIREMGKASTIKEYDRAIYSNDKLANLKKMKIKI